ncbi:MAG: hypothetical protein HQK52_05700 [Oligoflexia bacterium]|nr:hypothetical protein [Oligoflexia bacterium]
MGLLIGSGVIFIFGFVDDIFRLRPHYKLLGQLLAVGAATYFGLVMTFFSSPVFSLFITILWFFGISNAFNLLDNMDGLSSGIAIAASITIAVHSWIIGNYAVLFVSFILASSILGFWIFNKNPAKIFMGDCGSQFIGFMLAGLAIMGTWRDASNLFLTILVPVLILAIPIFDTTFVSIMRKFHGKKITDGGKDHLSHRLVAMGLSERRAVNILIFLGLATGLTTIIVLNAFNAYLALGLFPLVAISFALIGSFLAQTNVYNVPASFPRIMGTSIPNMSKAIMHKASGFRWWKHKVVEGTLRMSFLVDYKRRFAEVVVDIILLFISLFAAYNLRFESHFSMYYVEQFTDTVIAFIAIKIAVLFWQGMYRGDWKYMGIADVIILTKSSLISFLFIVAYVGLTYRFSNFSRAVIILDFVFSLMSLGGVRIALRVMNEYIFQHRKDFVPVVIWGNDKDELDLSLRKIKMKSQYNYRPVALYCDKVPRKGVALHQYWNDSIQGIEVINESKRLLSVLDKKKIKEIFVLSGAGQGNSVMLKELESKGFKIIKENQDDYLSYSATP